MVFDWFFGEKKSGGAKAKYLFAEFLVELKKLEVVDEILDALLEDKAVDEEASRVHIIAAARNLEQLFNVFVERIKKQEETLRLYVVTSVTEHDYLTELQAVNEELLGLFKKIDEQLHKSDFWKFAESCQEINGLVEINLKKLAAIMKAFQVQSKESLEWNYTSGSINIDLNVFKSLIRELGGNIVPSRGKGGHFGVDFNLFMGETGPSQKFKNQITGRTLKGFIKDSFKLKVESDAAKVARIEARNITVDKLKDYLLCYFYVNNPVFRRTFKEKYKDLFKI